MATGATPAKLAAAASRVSKHSNTFSSFVIVSRSVMRDVRFISLTAPLPRLATSEQRTNSPRPPLPIARSFVTASRPTSVSPV